MVLPYQFKPLIKSHSLKVAEAEGHVGTLSTIGKCRPQEEEMEEDNTTGQD